MINSNVHTTPQNPVNVLLLPQFAIKESHNRRVPCSINTCTPKIRARIASATLEHANFNGCCCCCLVFSRLVASYGTLCFTASCHCAHAHALRPLLFLHNNKNEMFLIYLFYMLISTHSARRNVQTDTHFERQKERKKTLALYGATPLCFFLLHP